MKMNSVRKTAVVLTGAALASVVTTAQPAQAALVAGSTCSLTSGCSVDAINAANGLEVGDFLFSNFTAQGTPVSQFNNIGDLINILPVNLPNQVGIGVSASLLANSANTPVKNLTLKYKVTAIGSALLNGISATLDGALASGTGQVSLAELAFDDAARTNSIASLLLGTPSPTSGTSLFASPESMVWLTKDITADAGTAGIAHFSSLINYNDTTDIPTPALLPGLLGFGATILRKRKQAAAIA